MLFQNAKIYDIRHVELDSGITLNFTTFNFREDCVKPFEVSSGMVSFWICFSGIEKSTLRGIANDVVLRCGQCGMFIMKERFEGKAIISRHKPFQAISFHLDPGVLIKVIGDEGYSSLPESCRRIINGTGEGCFSHSLPINPMVRLILEQILNCSVKDGIRRLYYEGKALELIASILQTMKSGKATAAFRLCNADVERLHYAEKLLVRDIAHPPSLMRLARDVGMHHTKLNKGFKEVFGCTVFDHLRKARLKKAATLLCDGQMNCTDVSLSVGYTSLSHFSKAFRKQFGVTPRSFRSHFYPN
jgi:AraC-like DNA-binding protein